MAILQSACSGCAGLLCGLGKDSAPVESVINYFANGGSIRIYVHSITGTQVSDNTLGRYPHSYPRQLRIPTRLNVVNSKKPLIQRQMFTKSHDLFNSSIKPDLSHRLDTGVLIPTS